MTLTKKILIGLTVIAGTIFHVSTKKVSMGSLEMENLLNSKSK